MMPLRWPPCEVCDREGPLEPTTRDALFELNRAIHRLGRVMIVEELLRIPLYGRWLRRMIEGGVSG